jgi:hypothetical protein
MSAVNQGAIGGVANESGSNHRSIGAALIAAYGLNGKSIAWLGADAWPARIGLETDHAVDDIEVILSDGRVVHVQAKRSCGLGPAFKKSAAQWAAAAKSGETKSVSRFVLLVSDATGSLKVLRDALDHWRAGTSLTEGEKDSRKVAIELLTSEHGLSRRKAKYVMKKVFVAVIDTDSSGQASQLGGAVLDTAVVAPEAGPAAFAILTNFFHDNSRQRKQTGIDDWRLALRAAQLPVHSDPNGVLAAQLQAKDDEIASFRRNLAKTKDEVNFFSLDFEVQKFSRPGCSQALRVRALRESTSNTIRRPDATPLLSITRREGRFVLVGGPGVGKSFSLGQIAGAFAEDTNAPLPLPLRLRDVSTSLNVLPVSSSWGFREIARHLAANNEVLELALLERMQHGDVIYLFDGLDEVVNDRSKVVSWLDDFLDNLSAHTDLVVSSRHAVAGIAELDLPQYELLPPDDLVELTDDVLVKFAENVPTKGGERTIWLQSRRAFIKHAQSKDRDLWNVPLLAILMIAILIDRGPAGVPKSRSGLLRMAIESSVSRWEMRRIDGIEAGLPDQYQPQIVIDTFADIAGVVADGGAWGVAFDAVVARLPHWGIPAPAAPSWATAILRFWDETAAVFVTSSEGGRLTARSRLFTELGVAMLLDRDITAMKEWVVANKTDADSYHAMRLLCGLDPTAMDWIAELAVQGASELLDVILDAVEEGAILDPSIQGRVLDRHLARLPTLPRSAKTEDKNADDTGIKKFLTGPVDEAYRLAVRIARYPLSEAQDSAIWQFALGHLDPRQTSVVLAVREIQSPRHPANSDEHWRVIADALPPAPDRSRKDGYIAPWRDIDTSGLYVVTRYAAEQLTPEREELALRVLAAAHIGPIYDVDEVRALLVEKGFRENLGMLDLHFGTELFESLPKSFSTTDQPLSLLIDCLGEPGESARADLWHLSEASAAYDLLRVNDVAFGQLYWAIETFPELSAAIARKIVDDSSLTTNEVAAQIHAVSTLGRYGSMLLDIPSDRAPRARLSPTDGWEEMAIAAWGTGNAWLGLQALTLSLDAEGFTESSLHTLKAALGGLSPTARRQIGLVVEYHHPGQAWLLSDPLARAGVCRVQSGMAWAAKDNETLVELFQDPDLSVRNEAIPDDALPNELVELLRTTLPRPECWSCQRCGSALGIDADKCSCGNNRPDDELEKLMSVPN